MGDHRRSDTQPLATYLFVFAYLGGICGILVSLLLYDNATHLFRDGGIGLAVGALVSIVLSR
jgi:hypothetical protein